MEHKERRMGSDRRSGEHAVTANEVELIAERVADEASQRAVRKVFAILGVDIDEPSEVETFRDDLRFGRRLRKAADHSWLAFVGAFTILLVSAVGYGLRELLTRGN